MKVGGQILWNEIPFCETSQIYYLMGRRPMKDVLGNHLKDLLFHVVHWLSIGPVNNPSIWKDKSYLDCSSDTLCTRGEFGRVTYWLQDLEELETMDASEIYSKRTQCERGDISQREMENLFFQSQMDESKPLEEIRT